MKKLYLVKIQYGNAAYMHIAVNTDGLKPVYVYYCGRDTGRRYKNIGSASRYLEKTAADWQKNNKYRLPIHRFFRPAADIPVYGSNLKDVEYFKNMLREGKKS